MILTFMAISCQEESSRIEKLVGKLSPIVNMLETEHRYKNGGEYLTEVHNDYPEIIGPLIKDRKLCSIVKYRDMGIAFVFSCEIDLESRSFFIDDNRYNLIKVTNDEKLMEFLEMEQFVDYGRKPKNLGNGWFYIEQNIPND